MFLSDPRRVLRSLSLCAAISVYCALFAQAPAQPNPLDYPLGASIVDSSEGGGVVFRVWAPNAQTARVPGEFNSWNIAATSAMMTKGGDGIWSGYVANAQVGDEYKFYIDGLAPWRVDPYTRNSVNSDGNGIIEDAEYDWQATDWETPPHEEMIIYQLHVGTFTGNGDGGTNSPGHYRDIVDLHLDYLKSLNINMVQLMPIHEFPGSRSWGYNPVHFFAPESDYGSPDDLRYLIDTLQQNGIGVILDVVWNHTSNSDNNLWQFDGGENIYFYTTGDPCTDETQWGPRPNFASPQVRQLFEDNAAYWLDEFRMDGYRLDFTRAMRGYCNENGDGWLLLNNIVNRARSTNPRALLTVEDLPNDPSMTTPQSQGGAGYDAQWSDGFHDVMRAQLKETDPNMWSISDVVAGAGFDRPANEAVKFIDNHDESGNGERITVAIDPADPFSERAMGLNKVGGAMVLLSPGIPLLFMGQEFMEDKQFGDDEGDRIWWGFVDLYGGIKDFYARLCQLRRTRPSLFSTSGVQIIQVNDGANVIAFQRFDNQGDVTLVVANFGASSFTNYNIGAPSAGTWYEIAGSDRSEFQGSGVVNGDRVATPNAMDNQPATLEVALPPYSVHVFSKTPLQEAKNPGNIWSLY